MAELKDLSSVVLSATEDRGPAAVVLMLTEQHHDNTMEQHQTTHASC